MTQTHTPDRIFVWVCRNGEKMHHVWRGKVGSGGEGQNEYLLSTSARESAPDMLEALREARRMLLHYGTRDTGGIAQIDAAIAKATGEAQ
jgi:hypothetical protein